MKDYYLPHSSIIFTSNKLLNQFKYSKILPAYKSFISSRYRSTVPWELEIHLSGYCTLKCKECSYSSRHQGLLLEPECINSLFNELSNSDLHFLFFSGGGDPLVWPYWNELLEARKTFLNNVPVGISTNAASCISFPIYEINKYQIHIVGYDKESYISETGADVFDIVCKNISDICKSGSEVTLKLLLNKNVLMNINSYLDFIAKFDCDNVVLKVPQNFLYNDSGVSVDYSELQEKVKGHNICSKFERTIFNLQDDIFDNDILLSKCCIVHSGLYSLIREDGNVYPCIASTFSAENALGNIKHNTLSDIMSSIDLSRYDRNMLLEKCPTKACRHYHMNKYIELVEEGVIAIDESSDNAIWPEMI